MSNNYKELVEKINATFTEGDTEGFLDHCNDNLKWTMVGEKTVEGKDAVRSFMGQMEGMTPPSFTVDAVVSDGEYAVAHGDMTMQEQDGTTGEYRYCDFYRFENDKVAELTSYVIKTNKGEN